jgi:hypothetical protein
MLRKLMIPTAIAAALTVTPVLADQSGGTGGSKAERQQEMGTGAQGNTGRSAATRSFDDLDRNQDGQLDEDELNTWGSTAAGSATGDQVDEDRGERMMQRYDRDGDGSVSQDEMDRGPMTGTETTQ